MSDTTTPSAAEVMGWEQRTIEGRLWWVPPRWASSSLAAERIDSAEYTPDDMLAFLRQRFYAVTVWWSKDMASLAVETETEDGYVDDYTAPTLHAALEQAVIAVGRAE